ncbi:hypothetical protein NQZ68_014020 [Dissostichus eleginoides]|nr:hypothetical protein NQZ68_014020 [Dissostichus eleginoides]
MSYYSIRPSSSASFSSNSTASGIEDDSASLMQQKLEKQVSDQKHTSKKRQLKWRTRKCKYSEVKRKADKGVGFHPLAIIRPRVESGRRG